LNERFKGKILIKTRLGAMAAGRTRWPGWVWGGGGLLFGVGGRLGVGCGCGVWVPNPSWGLMNGSRMLGCKPLPLPARMCHWVLPCPRTRLFRGGSQSCPVVRNPAPRRTSEEVRFPTPKEVRFPTSEEVRFPTPKEVRFPTSEEVRFPTPKEVRFPTSEEVRFPAPNQRSAVSDI
jgi:hypothetical protein